LKNSDNLLHRKSYAFSIRTIKLSKYLQEEHREYTLARQILRSGTSIGALISESKFAQSPADFIHKLSIALKEANETKYWIELLHDTEYINQTMYKSLSNDIKELIRLLVTIIKKLKAKQ